MVSPSDCKRCRLAADSSMVLTLACESESMIRTFLRNLADRVSATESTRVDLPTPPLVFMTATVLRMLVTIPLLGPLLGPLLRLRIVRRACLRRTGVPGQCG